MSSLTAIFGNSEEKSEDSDKLMELYWNRAELKKEFAGMRKEQYRLQELIKAEEGKVARVQQQLEHLENLLIDPGWAHNVVVHFQLRGLGHKAERKLARFAEQLKQQREQREQDNALGDWKKLCMQEAAGIEEEVLVVHDTIRQLEDQLSFEQRKLTSMNAIVRFFRGRPVMNLIDALAADIELAVSQDQALHEQLEEIMNRRAPDSVGLDIPAKRSVNMMILAYAQQIFIQFDKDDLASLVKESTQRSVGAINYGTRHECEQLLKRIDSAMERMDSSTDYADVMKQRAVFLSERVQFARSDDAVPVPGSVATLLRIDDNGVVRESDVNIVGENYWAIASAFSR